MITDPLCTTFLHSLSTNVKADPKKLSAHLRKHFVSRTFYLGSKSRYYFEVSPGNYIVVNQQTLSEEVEIAGLLYAPKKVASKLPSKHVPKTKQRATTLEKEEKAAAQTQLRKYFSELRRAHYIDWAGALSGHFPGPITINNVRCLITRGPQLIEPKKRDHLPVYQIIESLFGRAPEQLDYVLACLQRYRRLLLQKRYEPMQTLILAGTHDDGKTLFATEILGPAFGDRRVDASHYLIGETRFNADLAGNELWLMDDHNETRWYDLRVLESILKKVAANPDIRAEAKGIDAFNARDLFRVVVLLFNIEGTGGSHLIPPLAEDSKDKLHIFHTQRATLPTGPNQFAEIRALIRSHMPAFLYWLDNEFVPKAEILSGDRYQIKAYHNPEVCAQIEKNSPAENLLPLLDRWLERDQDRRMAGECD
jgi:hypothetical protein